MIKKFIIAAVIILVITGIITAAAAIFKHHMKNNILDGPGMVREPHDYIDFCSYYHGGGMDGSYESIELKRLDDGAVTYSYRYCPYQGAEEVQAEKVYGGEVFSKISEICKRTGVLTWGTLPKNEIIVLDAPSTTITFTCFGDTTYSSFSVHSGDILPESGNGLFTEIYDYLISLK